MFYSIFCGTPPMLGHFFLLCSAVVGDVLDYKDPHVRSFKNVFRDVNSLVDSLNLF